MNSKEEVEKEEVEMQRTKKRQKDIKVKWIQIKDVSGFKPIIGLLFTPPHFRVSWVCQSV